MMTITRLGWYPVLAGLTFGTVLFAGCASPGKNDPPASVPTSSSQASSQLRPVRTVASGDELEPSVAAANHSEREGAVAQRATIKRLKPIDWSTKTISQGAGDIGGASAVSGAVPAAGSPPMPASPPVPALFAERRASEALDRLAGFVTIRHEKRGSVIMLPSDRLFDSGAWALTSSGQYSLRELVVGLRDQDGRTIRIQGYTDSMGTPAVNDAVSLRRAEAVRDFFVAQGVTAENLRAEGMGAKRPRSHNGTPEGRAQNRRIEIVMAPLE
jgi:outer membrane protein OmpA-like peptidoglycan-associated protein